MSLSENSKIQALVAKAGKLTGDDRAEQLVIKAAEIADAETAKAVKAETKRLLAVVKDTITEAVAEAKEAGAKESAKLLTELGKNITEAAKAE